MSKSLTEGPFSASVLLRCRLSLRSVWSAEGIPFRLTLNTTKPLLCILKADSSPVSSFSQVLLLLPPSLGPGGPTFAPPFSAHLLCITLSIHLCDWSHIISFYFQLQNMVLLTPKFVFVAVLASLTAFSLAPTADAAAIAVRRDHQHYSSGSPGTWPSPSSNDVDRPTIPLPARLTSASGKHAQDRNGEFPRGSLKVTCPSLISPASV